jgi:hypothetical protein
MDNSRRRKRGPKMLALAADVADGALPAGRPLEFTERARDVLGPHRLLTAETQPCGGPSSPTARRLVP